MMWLNTDDELKDFRLGQDIYQPHRAMRTVLVIVDGQGVEENSQLTASLMAIGAIRL